MTVTVGMLRTYMDSSLVTEDLIPTARLDIILTQTQAIIDSEKATDSTAAEVDNAVYALGAFLALGALSAAHKLATGTELPNARDAMLHYEALQADLRSILARSGNYGPGPPIEAHDFDSLETSLLSITSYK